MIIMNGMVIDYNDKDIVGDNDDKDKMEEACKAEEYLDQRNNVSRSIKRET